MRWLFLCLSVGACTHDAPRGPRTLPPAEALLRGYAPDLEAIATAADRITSETRPSVPWPRVASPALGTALAQQALGVEVSYLGSRPIVFRSLGNVSRQGGSSDIATIDLPDAMLSVLCPALHDDDPRAVTLLLRRGLEDRTKTQLRIQVTIRASSPLCLPPDDGEARAARRLVGAREAGLLACFDRLASIAGASSTPLSCPALPDADLRGAQLLPANSSVERELDVVPHHDVVLDPVPVGGYRARADRWIGVSQAAGPLVTISGHTTSGGELVTQIHLR